MTSNYGKTKGNTNQWFEGFNQDECELSYQAYWVNFRSNFY